MSVHIGVVFNLIYISCLYYFVFVANVETLEILILLHYCKSHQMIISAFQEFGGCFRVAVHSPLICLH